MAHAGRSRGPGAAAQGSGAGACCGQTCTFIYKKARARQDSGIGQGPTSHVPCPAGTSPKLLHLLQPVRLGGRYLPLFLPRVFPAGTEGTGGPGANTQPWLWGGSATAKAKGEGKGSPGPPHQPPIHSHRGRGWKLQSPGMPILQQHQGSLRGTDRGEGGQGEAEEWGQHRLPQPGGSRGAPAHGGVSWRPQPPTGSSCVLVVGAGAMLAGAGERGPAALH